MISNYPMYKNGFELNALTGWVWAELIYSMIHDEGQYGEHFEILFQEKN